MYSTSATAIKRYFRAQRIAMVVVTALCVFELALMLIILAAPGAAISVIGIVIGYGGVTLGMILCARWLVIRRRTYVIVRNALLMTMTALWGALLTPAPILINVLLIGFVGLALTSNWMYLRIPIDTYHNLLIPPDALVETLEANNAGQYDWHEGIIESLEIQGQCRIYTIRLSSGRMVTTQQVRVANPEIWS